MPSQTVISVNGPLPLKATFNSPSSLPMILFVSGSAYTSGQGGWIGAVVTLDNATIGELVVWCNLSEAHSALIPLMLPVNAGFGEHTVTLTAINDQTVTDQNDYFNVVLIY
ncbi:MAG TPA: hypothetical protein VF546_07345 [Pyrinomonadaceae bacterium]|jgi:hypothetical protein